EPRRELRQPPVDARPVKRGDGEITLEVLEQIGIGEEEKGAEGHLARLGFRLTRVDADGCVSWGEGEVSGNSRPPEEEAVGIEGQGRAAQFSRPIRRWSSCRAGVS